MSMITLPINTKRKLTIAGTKPTMLEIRITGALLNMNRIFHTSTLNIDLFAYTWIRWAATHSTDTITNT